ncbi:MAG: hypothetical protein ACTHNK_01965 [Thermomicrobiales bacterium]
MTALTETQPAGAPEPEPDAVPAAPAPRAGLAARTWREILLVLMLLVFYGYFQQIAAWNEYSHYDLVVALVDDHTTRIDPYVQNTGDTSVYQGHYYSNKQPGASFLGAPIYLALRLAARVAGNGVVEPDRAVQALAFGLSGVPTALLVLLLYRFLRAAVAEWWALAVALGYGLGTIALPFATMYYSHALAAFLLFAAFYALWRAGRDAPSWYAALAGVLAGLAVLTEIPAALGVAVLLVYALVQSRRALLLVVAGGIPSALALGAYNLVSFGSPLMLSYNALALPGFQQETSKGLLGVTMPRLTTLSTITFGPRGLLFLSPWLIFVPLGLVALRRREIRREVLVCGVISLVFLIFNAGYFAPIGGAVPGPRYLIPALPFAAALVAFVPVVFRPLLLAELAYSIAIQLLITITSPFTPESLTVPLSQLWVPLLAGRVLAPNFGWLRWGLPGLAPLFVLLAVAALGAVGLVVTTRRTASRGIMSAITVLLAITLLLFSTPLDLAHGLSGGRVAADTPADVAIVAAGTLNLPADQGPAQVMCWAQIVNHSGAAAHTRVKFAVYTPDGQMTWGGWVADVAWAPGQRRQTSIIWTRQNVAPGNYRLAVAVISDDQQTVYAQDEDAATIAIR